MQLKVLNRNNKNKSRVSTAGTIPGN
uniref:Uncharacterized protein n=1 Tax=Anguilla anguilla TaxID=7936 RepID=A0A0E9VQM7_ANGAN